MFPDIDFIRLDTPKSRRGNFSNIVREIRWELNLRGYNNIKIMVSGGLDKDSVIKLREAGAEAFGVGTSISSAKPIDFSMDIVRIDNEDVTKRGKYSGKKLVSKCVKCNSLKVSPRGNNPNTCKCGGSFRSMNLKIIDNGKRIIGERSDHEIRTETVKQLETIIIHDEKTVS
ncbi:Quinolinate phosphoribosyl transferase [mine drainage metagenome]|uniref:Quinolinate phosphoribosyl transferase n=1 Tax=mine drainage metagenome TaxID=410659 RepID=T1D1F3_9ZZZZ